MKFNLLKQNLPFVLLCTIATAGISIPFITQADTTVKHPTIEQKDLTLAQQIVDTVTVAIKHLFTHKTTEKIVKITNYLNDVQPCGPSSTMVLQSVQKLWTELVSEFKKVNGIIYAKKHLKSAFNKIGDGMSSLVDNVENKGWPTSNWRTTLKEMKNIGNGIGMLAEMKIAKNIMKISWI